MAETFESLKSKIGDWLAVDTTRLSDSVRGFAINLIQLRVMRNHDLRFGEVADTLALSVNDGEYALPTGWRSPIDVWYTNPDTSSKVNLVRLTKDEFDELYPDPVETGTPANYAVWGQTLYVGPTPEQPVTLHRNYYRFLPDLADGAPNNTNAFVVEAPDVLFYGALAELSAYLIEDARMPMFAAKFMELEADLAGEHQREKSAGRVAQSREPG